MPPNIREIKKRINSVEKTKKITQAMKMVAAAKFKRNVKALDHIKEYGKSIDSIIDSLSGRLFNDDIPELLKENSAKKMAMVIVSSDRGLCGGFNSNLFRKVLSKLNKDQAVDLYLVGNKSKQFFKSKQVNIVDSRSAFNNKQPEEVSEFLDRLIVKYKKAEYSKLVVVYNEFVSALSSNIVEEQLLPISLPKWDKNKTSESDFIYEPSKKSSLTKLFIIYVNFLFSRAIQNSVASEEGNRMAAMDSATSNAKEMIQDLTLYYNRSRQAAITTEITEIVAGAASIS